jgi:1-acyl-sn-glycerol-3-phosphate acyltransferase
MLWKKFRTGGRFIRFCWVIATAAADFFFSVWLRPGPAGTAPRAVWMAKHARRVLRSLNVTVARHGLPPKRGLLAANHLGYLDIIVVGAAQPTVFLSKSEVRRWPIIGFLTAIAGTLYIRRDKKSDVARFDAAFSQVINSGVTLCIFPEGTSTDGHRILPFHASLLGTAATQDWPVTPVWLGYEVDEGSVENDVCYWGDMTFFTHFPRLISVTSLKAIVVYGDPLPPGLDRKQMARALHAQVCQMAEKYRPGYAQPVTPAANSNLLATGRSALDKIA